MKHLSLICTLCIFFIFTSFFATSVSAHQPIIVTKTQAPIMDPEVSRAFYDSLQNKSETYTITSTQPFTLYVNLLVPQSNPKGKFSATIYEGADKKNILKTLDGETIVWQGFFEPFGNDYYLKGPEYRKNVPAGTYQIEVFSQTNRGKYVLAIGEKEIFTPKDILRSMDVIPKLKANFFYSSPFTFLLTIFGGGYVLMLFVLSFIFGFIYRWILKQFRSKILRKRANQNIGSFDRFVRLGISVILFFWGVMLWNPILFFLSGFTLFETIFSWCGFYALIGKNTCDL